MSQPDNQPGNQPGNQTDLGSELRELGQQIEAALRTAFESDRARQVQQDISAGMREIGTQVQSAVKSLADNPRIQDLTDRGQQTLSQLQQSQAAHDLQESLARGIAQLNEQLNGFISRMQMPPAGDPPATGETTRLDDEK